MYKGLEVIGQKHIKFNCAIAQVFGYQLVFVHEKVVENSFFHQILYLSFSLLPMTFRKAKVFPLSTH